MALVRSSGGVHLALPVVKRAAPAACVRVRVSSARGRGGTQWCVRGETFLVSPRRRQPRTRVRLRQHGGRQRSCRRRVAKLATCPSCPAAPADHVRAVVRSASVVKSVVSRILLSGLSQLLLLQATGHVSTSICRSRLQFASVDARRGHLRFQRSTPH